MSKVSVVLAAYNGEKYIQEQLVSLLSQTYKIDEVIIVDDGSIDATVNIISDFIDNNHLDNWKLFKQGVNLGYIKTFANGLSKSSGDIVFLCDQDDIWLENKIEEMKKLFDEHEDIMCINSSFSYVDANDNTLNEEDKGTNYQMLNHQASKNGLLKITFDEILYHNISMGCTMAFRKRMKEIYLENSTFIAPHDWEINRIATLKDGLYFYNKKLMKYRIHDKNTVGNDKVGQKKLNNRIKNALTMLQYAESFQSITILMNNTQINKSTIFLAVCNKRFELLNKGKKSNWFYLIKNYAVYRRIISKKGMLIDLLFKKD